MWQSGIDTNSLDDFFQKTLHIKPFVCLALCYLSVIYSINEVF